MMRSACGKEVWVSEFEKLLGQVRISVERFVRYKIADRADAEDVLQEVYLAAYQKFAQLKNPDSFKAWILSIAGNGTDRRTESEKEKGWMNMKRLPEYMPEYKIEKTDKEPFAVKWEELMGWFLVPKIGERISWGMYDQPSGKCDHVYDMEVIGRAKVHGIEGVELTAREASYSNKKEVINRTFVAQLTDTHCRYLATIRNDNGVRNFITFLDGEEFMECWGYGEDNVGNETDLAPKGIIRREGNVVTTPGKDFVLDVVGRYDVTIAGKTYDTVCVLDISTYNNGVVSEQFLDQNDRLIVDGVTYVQWYDCITDYIFE